MNGQTASCPLSRRFLPGMIFIIDADIDGLSTCRVSIIRRWANPILINGHRALQCGRLGFGGVSVIGKARTYASTTAESALGVLTSIAMTYCIKPTQSRSTSYIFQRSIHIH